MVKKKKQESTTIDVLSHKLVSEMKVLTEAEKAKVLKQYGINERQLPRIRSTDPAAAALKAETGNIIRIQRDDGTGKYLTYRVVV
ncbi:DNA-directed RNA polymerase subunit H [Candidatus Micrarchaeota archaeon]|nr:DNA-directed RNA polymerase subunit H [Candidatus Micrarchaeota archaeon]